MLDTVHLEAPRVVEYARSFMPILRDLERTGGWKKGRGDYARVANLQPYGIDAMVHQHPRFNKDGGDKIELLQAGDKTVSQMTEVSRSIYRFNVADAKIMRLDCTADVKGVPVQYFRDHVRVKYKSVTREIGHFESYEKVRRAICDTIYGGVKPCQYRIYDKTGERLHKWRLERRQLPKEQREEFTFLQRWGYSPDQVITRVERALAARQPKKLYGLDYFGDIAQIASKPVFSTLVFPEVTRQNYQGLHGMDRLALQWLLEVRSRHGLQDAINEMKRALPRRTFYRKYPLFEAALHQTDGAHSITLQRLTEEFRTSTLVQIAA
jgi:hypothetical protein